MSLMLTPDEPAVLSHHYVTVRRAAALTGYTEKDILRNIKKGLWLEGYEYGRDADGVTLIDMAGFERWVEGKRPDVAPTVPAAPAEAPARRRRSLDAIPTALYRHFDQDGALLYVGVSLSPLARLSKHGDRSHWVTTIARVTMEWFPDRRAALNAEARAIIHERPAHNIAGNPSR